MKYCTYCGQELFDEAVVCPSCGCEAAPPPKEDRVSIGLCILLGWNWIIALVYWATTHKETPKRAKAVAISAFVYPFAFMFFYIFLALLLTAVARGV